MNRSFRFFSCVALLMLLAVVAQSSDDATRCDENGGFCVPRDLCDNETEVHHCDEENDVCCPHNASSETKPSNYGHGVILQPKKCQVDYEGVCQSDCERGRIPTDFCEKECICCGCPISNKCKANYGYCIPRGYTCRGVKVAKWCAGKRCTCCLPECPESEKCKANHGKCRKTCPTGEEPMPGADCLGGCKCCVPKCPESEKCAASQGKCRKDCLSGEEPKPGNDCPKGVNDSCKCCVPKCPESKACNAYRGKCRKDCYPEEKPMPGIYCLDGVNGSCKCCVPNK